MKFSQTPASGMGGIKS